MRNSTNKLSLLLFRRSGGWTLLISKCKTIQQYTITFFFQLNVPFFVLLFVCVKNADMKLNITRSVLTGKYWIR